MRGGVPCKGNCHLRSRESPKGDEPQKGKASPRLPKKDTLKERRPRELQSRQAGETVGRKKRCNPGEKLQDWLKLMMEPVPEKGRGADGSSFAQGDTCVVGRGKPGFVGWKP
jgi:hypothetical protein